MTRHSIPLWICGLGVGLAALGGCATSHEVKVDSLAKPDADAISYALRNANPSDKEDSLRYREAANLVRTALSGRGLYEVPPGALADVVVDLDYGVSAPQERREIRKWPVYQAPPERKITESSSQVGTNGDGSPIYQTSVSVSHPAMRPIREESYEVVITTYEKYLHLSAVENIPRADRGPAAEIWRVDVTSEGASRDLRKHLPVLVAASIEYIGKDSQGQKTIRIKDTDADLVFVKKGM